VSAALVQRGDPHTSAHLAAVADALCAARGIELDQYERGLIDEASVALREELGERFEEAWNAGSGDSTSRLRGSSH
jgi:hypothetical protein